MSFLVGLVFYRSWPGLPKTTLPDSPDYTLCRGTASVSTAKTTLGHLAVMDAREAAYTVGLWVRTLEATAVVVWFFKKTVIES